MSERVPLVKPWQVSCHKHYAVAVAALPKCQARKRQLNSFWSCRCDTTKDWSQVYRYQIWHLTNKMASKNNAWMIHLLAAQWLIFWIHAVVVEVSMISSLLDKAQSTCTWWLNIRCWNVYQSGCFYLEQVKQTWIEEPWFNGIKDLGSWSACTGG